MIEDKPLEITPLMSLSYHMYYSMHKENGEYKDSSLGGKIVTKIVDFCTILVGTIEFIARGALGILPFIVLTTILDDKLEKNSILQIVVGDILCSGAWASAEAVFLSGASLVKREC